MSFTNQSNENTNGITNTIAGYLPLLTLAFEQLTGQSIPQAKGTLADILSCLQRLETKVIALEKNCAEQFLLQETQLNSLLTNTQSIQDFRHLLEGKEIKFIKN